MKERSRRMYISLLLVVCLLFSSVCVNRVAESKSVKYTSSQVRMMLKKAEEKVEVIQRKYEADKNRVREHNKGIMDTPLYTVNKYGNDCNGLYLRGTLIIVDVKKKTYYVVIKGESHLDISKNYYMGYFDGSVTVDGYIKKTGSSYFENGWTYCSVKGTDYTSNRYTTNLLDAKDRVSELKKALEFKYKVRKTTITVKIPPQKSLSLKKYLRNKNKYNEPIWSVDNKEIARIEKYSGKVYLKKGGIVKVYVKASTSGKSTFALKIKAIEKKKPDPTATPSAVSSPMPTVSPIVTSSATPSGTPSSTPSSTPTFSPSATPTSAPTASPKMWGIKDTLIPGPYRDKDSLYYAFLQEDDKYNDISTLYYKDCVKLTPKGDGVDSLSFTYSSDDEKVATVDSDGLVTITGNGIVGGGSGMRCVITISDNWGRSRDVIINVGIPEFTVKVIHNKMDGSTVEETLSEAAVPGDPYNVSGKFYVGETLQFVCGPEGAFDLDFSTSSGYITLDDTGLVTVIHAPESGNKQAVIRIEYGLWRISWTYAINIFPDEHEEK